MSVETVMQGLEAPVVTPLVTQEPAKEVQQPVEGQPPVETTDGKPTPEVAPEVTPEPEAEPDLETPSESSGDYEKFKAVFESHPDLKADLKNIIGREKAFTEMAPNGSFAELKEIMQRIPSLTDAEQLVADSENKRLFGQTFREDVPTFVESLKESDPLAFQQFATQLPEVLRESDPQLWSQQAKVYSDAVLNNILAIAQRDGNQALYDAVLTVAQGAGTRLGEQAPAPKVNSEVERLRRELADRKNTDAEAAFNSFWNQTDEVVINQSVTEIENSIKKALPSATEAQLKRMVSEAYGKTLEMINQQPQTLAQISSYRAMAQKGKQGIAEHKAIVSYITGRTKLVIPKAVKGVIDEWSGQVLKLNQDKTDKQKAIAAKTKDVGTGPQGTTSAANSAPPKAGPRHVKDVFAELAAGTYVKR